VAFGDLRFAPVPHRSPGRPPDPGAPRPPRSGPAPPGGPDPGWVCIRPLHHPRGSSAHPAPFGLPLPRPLAPKRPEGPRVPSLAEPEPAFPCSVVVRDPV